MDHFKYNQLAEAAFTYPAIDNHTHPLLLDSHRNKFPFEGLLSEATGEALTEDSIHTLACYRATKQLSELFACENNWQAVKTVRSSLAYSDLCSKCMDPTGIQCFLFDDGLDGESITETIRWHDQFSLAPSKQIVRIEIVAQV